MGNIMFVLSSAASVLKHKSFPPRANSHYLHKSTSTCSLSYTQPCEIEHLNGAPPRSDANNKPTTDHQILRERDDKVKPKPESSFINLPSGLRLAIFEHCAPIPSSRRSASTFLALTKVSKAIQHEARVACLPRTPVALRARKDIRSFRALLQHSPGLGYLVRYLWIGTWKYGKEELKWTVDILRAATRLKSFACGEFLLANAVNAEALAPVCGRLTLMNIEKGMEYEARHITHLRLCAGTYSTPEKFPNVTSLCFNARRNIARDEGAGLGYWAVEE
ncbi:hypothetical protein P691DRAFT_778838 [Macrolepiota fuliginosa MF-IS2]|uniref:Uncharacterized protein n=1 Tax=Macrolepiota fuliginosa MF-IS2 TaxID=1400762 RepID=A0A9P5X3S0_9AGAR|nr:hypothetical protein P691DRAFT_778838 [Macrolepiota fuliginosa MF-IS2]